MLRNPYILGGPQRNARGELAPSRLPSRGPKSQRKCYATPTFSGVPNAKHRHKIRIGCLTPLLSGAHKSAEGLCNPYVLGGPQRHATGRTSTMVTSPLPSLGPTSGRKCYVTLAFSGVPNAMQGGGGSQLAASPLPSRGPTSGRKCYLTLAFSGVPSAMQGGEITISYLTPAFSGTHKLAEVLLNPCILGGHQRQERGRKIEVASLPLPSEGPTSRRKGYVIPTLSGVPKQGNKISDGYFTPAFSRAHKWAEVLCNPCILGGRQRHARVKKSQ